jgi:hypothetical protein
MKQALFIAFLFCLKTQAQFSNAVHPSTHHSDINSGPADSIFVKRYPELTRGLNELENDKAIVVADPSNSKFTVSVDPFLKVEEISVFDADGKCVWKKHGGGIAQEIDLSKYSDGVYYLYVRTLHAYAVRKIEKG